MTAEIDTGLIVVGVVVTVFLIVFLAMSARTLRNERDEASSDAMREKEGRVHVQAALQREIERSMETDGKLEDARVALELAEERVVIHQNCLTGTQTELRGALAMLNDAEAKLREAQVAAAEWERKTQDMEAHIQRIEKAWDSTVKDKEKLHAELQALASDVSGLRTRAIRAETELHHLRHESLALVKPLIVRLETEVSI